VKALLLSSEVFPFAKTGGLGDVAGALPRALKTLGVDVAVATPFYRKTRKRKDRLETVAERVPCRFAGADRPFRLLRGVLPGPERVPVYFVENEGMFETDDALYGDAPGSYGDGHLRFLYFAFAALELPAALGFAPDVWHLQDWQAAAVAPLLRWTKNGDPAARRAATVLTIHNLAYQGAFPLADLRDAGVPEELLLEGRLAQNGGGNLLAAGIRYADALSTVSATYAREILTPEFGAGLDPVLRERESLLVGIVNGLDLDVWDPARDANLPEGYDAARLEPKTRVKAELLKRCGLEATDGPVFGVVSRFAAQKGLETVPPAMAPILEARPDVRLVALGSGEPDVEKAFRDLARRRPKQVYVRVGFDEAFSHVVEAGVDFFLMPSKFEPCGLNQLISMRYGTPPIVRKTGGLADTVVDVDAAAADRPATGFVFREPTAAALERAARRALSLYDRAPAKLAAMRRAGMTADWSWDRSARDYVRLFETARERRRRGSIHLEGLVPPPPVEEPLEPYLPPLPEVPDTYDRDALFAAARDPWTLYATWEIGGPESRRRLERLSDDERRRLTYLLRVVEFTRRETRDLDVGGFARDWFVDATPGATYDVELLAKVGDRPPELLMTAGPVTLPPAGHPDDPEGAP